MTQDTMTRSRLLEGLRDSERELLDRLRDVPASALENGCYESGWNARQVLAHVASIEWTYPRLIEVAQKASEPQPEAPPEKKPELPTRQAQGGIMSYNDRQVEKLADATVPELLALFAQNRATTIAAVEGADEALFDVPIKSAGGARGPMATVFNYVAVLHVRSHLDDILKSLSA
jgi:Mycothiol maleylpyruvate isomerase N-terminal domain